MVMGDERDNKQEVAEAPTNAHAAAYERLLEKQRSALQPLQRKLHAAPFQQQPRLGCRQLLDVQVAHAECAEYQRSAVRGPDGLDVMAPGRDLGRGLPFEVDHPSFVAIGLRMVVERDALAVGRKARELVALAFVEHLHLARTTDPDQAAARGRRAERLVDQLYCKMIQKYNLFHINES